MNGLIKNNNVELVNKKINNNSTNSYLKVSESKQGQQGGDIKKINSSSKKKVPSRVKSRNTSANSKKQTNQLYDEVKNEFLDVTLSTSYLYQYLYDYGWRNQRYFNILTIFSYITIVLINTTVFGFMTYARDPQISFITKCFDNGLLMYTKCTFRNWCSCYDWQTCVYVCSGNEIYCRKKLQDIYDNDKSTLKTNSLFTPKLYVRFETKSAEENNNLFHGIGTQDNEKGLCWTKFYSVIINILIISGGIFGTLIFGFLADNYGKKVIIQLLLTIGIISLVFTSIFCNYSYNSQNVNQFIITWSFISFFLGLSFIPMEYFMYLQFMEQYLNVDYIGTINGFFHTFFIFSAFLVFIFNGVLKRHDILFYITTLYFIIFYFIHFFIFVENPRFYSERRNFQAKRNSLEKMTIEKIVIIRKNEEIQPDHKQDEKLCKYLRFYDSSREYIDNNETIKPKKMESDIIKPVEDYFNNININSPRDVIKKKSGKRKSLPNISVNNTELKELTENMTSKKFQKSIIEDESNMAIAEVKFNINMYQKYNEDKYLNSYFFIYLIVWLSLSICFYGLAFEMVLEQANPNNTQRGFGVIIFTFIIGLILPSFVGYLTIYLDINHILIVLLFISSVMAFTIDIDKIYPDGERIDYYSNFENIPQSFYNRAIGIMCVMTAYSLFQVMTMSSVPTLYRTYFMSVCKTFSNMTGLLVYFSLTILDMPCINISIIGLFTCTIFLFVDVKWKENKLTDYADSEFDTKSNINKKLRIQKNSENSRSRNSKKKRT